jgi:D-tagatose-1,6-bisphosphate aldolase subunit GatZ/KbaZ
MSDVLLGLAAARAAGGTPCLASVCSAHPIVLEAALRHGVARGGPVLIEATCNQVNQDGGYTGLTPAMFRAQVQALAERCGLPEGRLLLGGDHLGPNPWTKLPAEAAMGKAAAMVATYVAAGFTKLHLDTSMPCADDPAVLVEAVIAARAAQLAAVAERTAAALGGPLPCYVIGTEVPPPGGARERIDTLEPTDPARAAQTIEAHRAAFAAARLPDLMARVIALVVQPGVEFGTDNVVPYDPAASRALVGLLETQPGLVFEAHSTDYQTAAALGALARDGFAILKVGPGLTFALREALYRLDALEAVLSPYRAAVPLPEVMEQAMMASPGHWQGHYHGDAAHLRLQRHYSYSDRIRYYWPDPKVQAAVAGLLGRLERIDLPETLISQFLPTALARVRAGTLAARADALLLAAVGDVLEGYARKEDLLF